jgi:hypothetical protein
MGEGEWRRLSEPQPGSWACARVSPAQGARHPALAGDDERRLQLRPTDKEAADQLRRLDLILSRATDHDHWTLGLMKDALGDAAE